MSGTNKRNRKFDIDVEEVHRKNLAGANLKELSKEYGIPKTTLNRYLREAGYKVPMNGRNPILWLKKENDFDHVFSTNNSTSWKQALVFYYGYKCFICGYDKIVEAHHIVPLNEEGLSTIKNGILLCPNHHGEAHLGILDLTEALVKLGELLENPEEDDQQPSQSNVMSIVDWKAQRLTDEDSQPINLTRAPKSGRMGKIEFLSKHTILRDMI
jgi:5-methylcytosine-specific restriction endonuclease McrA